MSTDMGDKPTSDQPATIHGLTVWVELHDGGHVLYYGGHPGEYHHGRQLDEFIAALQRFRPLITD
jgi:hypothetical protein